MRCRREFVRVIVRAAALHAAVLLCAGLFGAGFFGTGVSGAGQFRSALVAVSPRPQSLDLPGSLTPPDLDGPTYAAAVRATLEEEIQHFARMERAADESQRIVIRASINFRIIAAELLGQGEEAGADGRYSILAGYHIFRGRGDLDALLLSIQAGLDPAGGNADSSSTAMRAVNRFNETTVDRAGSIRTLEAERLDSALSEMFAPLADAASVFLGREAVSHWPTLRPPLGAGETEATDEAELVSSRLRSLGERLASTPLRVDSRAIIAAILAYLERGQRFRDLLAHVEQATLRIGGALDFAETLAAATWMDDGLRSSYEDQLHEALALYIDPASRSDGGTLLARLEVVRRILASITIIKASNDPTHGLVAALETADAPGSPREPESRTPRTLATLDVVTRRLARFRVQERAEVPSGWRPVSQRLMQAYRRTERRLVEALPEAMRDERAVTDPDLVSLVADHQRMLRAIERLDAFPSWRATVEGIDSASGKPFEQQLRRWTQALLDPHRRADAARALDAFERQSVAYVRLPFEEDLTQRTGPALVVTGGRADELLDRIQQVRRAWIRAWSRGEIEGPAAGQMAVLYRLTRTMRDVATITGVEPERILIDRWSGWETSSSLLLRMMSDLPNRLKLATVAVLDGDADSVGPQLDRIEREAPFATLAGRLSRRMGGQLTRLPDGALGVLGQLIYPPSPDAFMLEQRGDLADLCRYALETEEAWATARRAEAAALQAYVDALSHRLLRVASEGDP